MSDAPDPPTLQEDDIGALIRLAGPRPSPSAAANARVRAAVAAEWRRSLPPMRPTLRRALVAAAALVTIAILVFARAPWRYSALRTAAGIELATAVRVQGTVRCTSPKGPIEIDTGERLAAGALIETGPDGAAVFELDSGTAVRIDRESALTFETLTRLALNRGRVYVVSAGPAGTDDAVVVQTRLGPPLTCGGFGRSVERHA